MFDAELDRLKLFYSHLLKLQTPRLSFEERFHICELRFALEDLLGEHRESTPRVCNYCFFVNAQGIRHAELHPGEVDLARKIKDQQILNREEKEAALRLFRKF